MRQQSFNKLLLQFESYVSSVAQKTSKGKCSRKVIDVIFFGTSIMRNLQNDVSWTVIQKKFTFFLIWELGGQEQERLSTG